MATKSAPRLEKDKPLLPKDLKPSGDDPLVYSEDIPVASGLTFSIQAVYEMLDGKPLYVRVELQNKLTMAYQYLAEHYAPGTYTYSNLLYSRHVKDGRCTIRWTCNVLQRPEGKVYPAVRIVSASTATTWTKALRDRLRELVGQPQKPASTAKTATAGK